MASAIFSSLVQSSLFSPNQTTFLNHSEFISFSRQKFPLLSFPHNSRKSIFSKARQASLCFCNAGKDFSKRRQARLCVCNAGKDLKNSLGEPESGLVWPILKRWDVPWQWQTVSLASLACGLSFVLTGLVEVAALPYLGIKIEELSLDEKAEILFVDQSITTAVVLGVLLSITNKFGPLPEDAFRYDLKEPLDLQKGWLLWAAVGLIGALFAIALTGYITSTFSGETPKRETDALVQLLPLIGSSSVSTACLIGITGVLAPILEETVFRGFFMVAMTKWVPTPVAVVISAAAFALAHLTPGEFPQLFILGAALGLSYAQTRNLMAPITIHACWNSGVIVVLTLLQLQGYDIRELVQAN